MQSPALVVASIALGGLIGAIALPVGLRNDALKWKILGALLLTLAICSQLDSRIVLWSVDPQDWTPGRTPKQITKIVLANVRAGSIVELHDGGGDRSATARALPAIIRGIRARGLQLTTVEP